MHGRDRRNYAGIIIPILLLLANLTAGFPGESESSSVGPEPEPDIFGIVGLDPWYTYNADPVNFPDDVNRALLERMASDMQRLGARWIRIEFHAERGLPDGPGRIDYSKYDWFINELTPRYGLNILAVLGSGLIGDADPAWSFSHINDPLDESGSNPYINLYVDRTREIVERYGSRIAAVEVLNEPNANQILSNEANGRTKEVKPGHYGELIHRTYDTVKAISPETDVVMGGVLFDDENGTSYAVSGRSYDMSWLERVYGSRAVMSYQAEHGHHPFDAIAVHPYFMEPHEIISYLNEARRLQLRFGDRSGRIWITEVGWPAEPPENVTGLRLGVPSQSERKQAAFMSSIYTTVQQRAPFVERIFWFKYEDFPIDGSIRGWGLVRLEGTSDHYGSYSNPWPRKFAFSVYQALASPGYIPVAPVEPPIRDSVRYFEETGHTLAEPFLTFWEEGGGVECFGMPLTEPFDQGGHLVQYFERAKLEHYPEHVDDGRDIQIGLLGQYLVDARGIDVAPQEHGPNANQRHFPETGYSIIGAFRQFWDANDGMTRFGYPLTPEIVENGVTVQYFERARFEYVPLADGSGYEVRLGDIGSEALQIPGWYR